MKQSAAAGRVTRSMVDEDLDSNDAAFEGKSTNFKELSRLTIEDVLQCVEDTPLLLCIEKKINADHGNKLSDGASRQKTLGIGGDVCRIAGRQYYCLRVAIQSARKHLDIIHGNISEAEFLSDFEQKEGFVVRIVDSRDAGVQGSQNIKLTFAWRDVVEQPKEILFFGPPRASTRAFDPIFSNKSDVQYVFHTFKELAKEYWGDATASSQLYAAYLKRMRKLMEAKLEGAKLQAVEAIWTEFKSPTLTQKIFLSMFDGLCKNEFQLCVTEMNDYGTEIVLEEDLEHYVWAAEHRAFPKLWKVLAGMRFLKAKQKREEGKVQWKKRHIFFSLMSLVRMCNSRHLTWWAMIQSTANFGWGVGATSSDINCY
jgi:hypothetical protein